MSDGTYDLLVIGSGPAGLHGALTAARLGKRVAIIDHRRMLGGEAIRGGTIPSKTLREAILFLSGFHNRPFYSRNFDEQINEEQVLSRVQQVVERSARVSLAQLKKHGLTIIDGTARFVDPHTLEVATAEGATHLHGERILIACGSRPKRAPDVPYDGETIIDSGELQILRKLPREFIIVGAGVIGIEYGSMFAALGVEVTIIDSQAVLLGWLDQEIVGQLLQHMRRSAVVFHLEEKVAGIEKAGGGRVVAHLGSGKRIRGDLLLHAVGRIGNTDQLNPANAGLNTDSRGCLMVNEHYQTRVPHIYAAGDVIGFPALASASMMQGARAATEMFAPEQRTPPPVLPYAVWTVPEIAMVGATEDELAQQGVTFTTGVARYESLAKGQILGEPIGMLKLLFESQSHKLLGVHAIGETAAELIHIGQAILSLGGSIEYFRDTIFNHPTYAEAYKAAALDGLAKL